MSHKPPIKKPAFQKGTAGDLPALRKRRAASVSDDYVGDQNRLRQSIHCARKLATKQTRVNRHFSPLRLGKRDSIKPCLLGEGNRVLELERAIRCCSSRAYGVPVEQVGRPLVRSRVLEAVRLTC